jgi:hypothetical protein
MGRHTHLTKMTQSLAELGEFFNNLPRPASYFLLLVGNRENGIRPASFFFLLLVANRENGIRNDDEQRRWGVKYWFGCNHMPAWRSLSGGKEKPPSTRSFRSSLPASASDEFSRHLPRPRGPPAPSPAAVASDCGVVLRVPDQHPLQKIEIYLSVKIDEFIF